MPNKFDVITIGDSTVDTFLIIEEATLKKDVDEKQLLCLQYGDKVPIKECVQSVGGNAANVAIGLTKQGYNTGIVTELGDDINGLVIKKKLKQEGVKQDLIKVLKDKDSRYSIILHHQHERTILSSYVDREYSLPELPEANFIYYTSLGPSFENLQKELIEYIEKNSEVKLACNPGTHQMKKSQEEIKKIFPYLEVIFVNKAEAERLTGKSEVSIKELLKGLHEMGIKIVSITQGAEGAYVSNKENGKQIHMKPYPIEPKGRTGAGDAYASGFIGALLEGEDIETALKWASANAVGVIQNIGAHEGVLSKEEIKRTIEKYQPEVQPEKMI